MFRLKTVKLVFFLFVFLASQFVFSQVCSELEKPKYFGIDNKLGVEFDLSLYAKADSSTKEETVTVEVGSALLICTEANYMKVEPKEAGSTASDIDLCNENVEDKNICIGKNLIEKDSHYRVSFFEGASAGLIDFDRRVLKPVIKQMALFEAIKI